MVVDTSGNERSIDGNATFTIDRSRATMNAPATVTAKADQGMAGPGSADGAASSGPISCVMQRTIGIRVSSRNSLR